MLEEITIRQAESRDYPVIFELIKKAFEHEEHSDHREQFLVERLTQSDAFVPELSLVAESEEQIIGYILLNKIQIVNAESKNTALALAPVAVLPERQGQGVGGKLIQAAHQSAVTAGFDSIILLGHANYYPKFGYQPANHYDISLPFDVPEENCMAIELKQNALAEISGVVEYPKAFFEY